MPDTEFIFNENHNICKAYQEKVYQGKSDTWVFSMLCDSFQLDPDSDDADTLEKHLIGYFQQQELVFEYSEELLTVITEGKMQVLSTEVVLETAELGNVTLFRALQLVVNGKVKAQSHNMDMKQSIVEAFQAQFPDRTIKDLESLSYDNRIDTVMRAYHSLHPRDGIKSVIAACRKACPDVNFTSEVQRPEFIGEAYMSYLLQMIEEGREKQYIMSLSRYIDSGKYMEYKNSGEAELNLWGQPSHLLAYDIFQTATMYANEVSKNSEQKPRKKRAKHKPGTGKGNGDGHGGSGKGADDDEPAVV